MAKFTFNAFASTKEVFEDIRNATRLSDGVLAFIKDVLKDEKGAEMSKVFDRKPFYRTYEMFAEMTLERVVKDGGLSDADMTERKFIVTKRADGDVEAILADDGLPFELEEMQEFVGGYIEPFYPFSAPELKQCYGYCNDEGKLNMLPISFFYGDGRGQVIEDLIVGNTIFYGGVDDEGNSMLLTKYEALRIRNAINARNLWGGKYVADV